MSKRKQVYVTESVNAERDSAQYAKAWAEMMNRIWQDKIEVMGAMDTGRLIDSVQLVTASSQGLSHEVVHQFVQYGLYVDAGVGRGYRGNGGDLANKGLKVRERRPWFSKAYYVSLLRMRDAMGDILGDGFVGMFGNMVEEIVMG